MLQNIYETEISDSLIALFTASSSSSSLYFLSPWDLGPLSQHHCIKIYKRHVVDKDLSIPELLPRNKRNRRKICRNVQFAESMGQL